MLGDWLAQPKEPPRDQNLKQAPSSSTAKLLAALDRAYDRIAIEALGNHAESTETLRELFAELQEIVGNRFQIENCDSRCGPRGIVSHLALARKLFRLASGMFSAPAGHLTFSSDSALLSLMRNEGGVIDFAEVWR